MLRLSQHTSTMHDFQTQRLSRPIPYSGLSRLRFWWVFSLRMNFPKTILRMGSGGTRYFYLCTFFEHLSLSLSFSLSLYLSLSLSISTTSTSSHVSCLSLSACTPAEPPPDGSLTMDLTISLSMGRERKSRRHRASDTDAMNPRPQPQTFSSELFFQTISLSMGRKRTSRSRRGRDEWGVHNFLTFLLAFCLTCAHVATFCRISTYVATFLPLLPLSMGRERTCRSSRASVADGIGTPDPSPKHLVSWCF